MAVVYELAWRGGPAVGDRWEARAEILLELPGLVALDLYRPAIGRAQDPFVDDGPGPLALALLQFRDLAALEAALRHRRVFRQAAIGVAVTGQAMERQCFPVAGESALAPFSYVVRYYEPAEDAAAFRRHYLATLPALQASLPGIRSIICYLPLAMPGPNDLPAAGYLIGNEVAFDSLAAFNQAMASEVRQLLKRQSADLPRFCGRSTHHPMDRVRLAGG